MFFHWPKAISKAASSMNAIGTATFDSIWYIVVSLDCADWYVLISFSIDTIGLLINFISFLSTESSFLMFFHWPNAISKTFLRIWSRLFKCGFADLTLVFLGFALIEVLWISSSSISIVSLTKAAGIRSFCWGINTKLSVEIVSFTVSDKSSSSESSIPCFLFLLEDSIVSGTKTGFACIKKAEESAESPWISSSW
ncbi:unnamed protein product [Blepharisma stoltei]|uniref:Uncharacterized protein n=1 Tax=Blepharisma stoltei TaxID=1481888 RepID=A0AAU9K203_9CILI|nr:unnamed protein product [Blepharisma stoltei]